jgi:hypothetical protein
VEETELLLSRDSDTSPPPAAYDQSLLGEWVLTDGSFGVLDAFAANGHYVTAFGTSSTQVLDGQLFDVTSTFAGDGNWLLVGPLLATFPTGGTTGGSTDIILIYDETIGSAGTVHRLCRLSRGVDQPLNYVCEGRP